MVQSERYNALARVIPTWFSHFQQSALSNSDLCLPRWSSAMNLEAEAIMSVSYKSWSATGPKVAKGECSTIIAVLTDQAIWPALEDGSSAYWGGAYASYMCWDKKLCLYPLSVGPFGSRGKAEYVIKPVGAKSITLSVELRMEQVRTRNLLRIIAKLCPLNSLLCPDACHLQDRDFLNVWSCKGNASSSNTSSLANSSSTSRYSSFFSPSTIDRLSYDGCVKVFSGTGELSSRIATLPCEMNVNASEVIIEVLTDVSNNYLSGYHFKYKSSTQYVDQESFGECGTEVHYIKTNASGTISGHSPIFFL